MYRSSNRESRSSSRKSRSPIRKLQSGNRKAKSPNKKSAEISGDAVFFCCISHRNVVFLHQVL